MCNSCDPKDNSHFPNRRHFLRLVGISTVGAAALAKGKVFAAQAGAYRPPKPQNVLSSQAALDRLMEGNKRYVDGLTRRHDFINEREALSAGQNPYAGILSCADSRIAPEYAFDSARGDLFAVRVAGNFVNDDGLASLEYGVAVLKIPLLMVLGHDGCGAVDAGVKAVKNGVKFPGHIQLLADAIAPSVKKALEQDGHTLEHAIRQNVLNNVEKLKQSGPILAEEVTSGKLKIVGGVYRLGSGKVELVG